MVEQLTSGRGPVTIVTRHEHSCVPRPGRARRGRASACALVALAGLVLAAALTGCGGSGGSSETRPEQDASPAAAVQASYPVTLTDDASRTVTIDAKPGRIVSLAPANTEIVTALGVPLSALVGVTTFDDYPAEVKDLPKIGDFMNPNIEAITAARPDLVLATGGVQADVIGKLEAAGAKVLVVDPQTLDGVFRAIEMVGSAVGEPSAAAQLADSMRGDLKKTADAVAGAERTSAFLEIGYDPLFTAGSGTLMDDLISAAGGRNVVAEPGYVAYSVEQLLKADPTVYLAVKGTSGDPSALRARAGYDKLASVRDGRVAILEDNLVTRPGPRVIEGVRAIAEALHPDAFGK